MALDRVQLIELTKANAKASLNPAKSFSFGGQDLTSEALSKTFTSELNELGKTPRDFENNKNLIFELIEVGLTEVLPVKVLQSYGPIADIQTYGNNDKPVFKINISEASKKRAKQFVTKVGAAGRYETFKLDGYTLEVPTSVYGGAAKVEWEDLLSGRFSLNDYYQLVLEGLDDTVYREIAKSLKAAVTDISTARPANYHTDTVFDENEFDRLLMTADAYGKSTIYCTYEFATKMIPTNAWNMSGSNVSTDRWSNEMKNQYWSNGAFTSYKGHTVIVLPQSFEDDSNEVKVIDPSLCYIIPTGSEKPVKVAFQGAAQVKSFENRDWSTEIQTYQKLGVATYLVNPGICVYENKSLHIENIEPIPSL